MMVKPNQTDPQGDTGKGPIPVPDITSSLMSNQHQLSHLLSRLQNPPDTRDALTAQTRAEHIVQDNPSTSYLLLISTFRSGETLCVPRLCRQPCTSSHSESSTGTRTFDCLRLGLELLAISTARFPAPLFNEPLL